MSGSIPVSQSRIKATRHLSQVERKLGIVLKGMRGNRPVKELCREAGISPTSYYHWQRQVIDAARIGLAHPEVENDALKEHIQQLEAEIAGLQRQVRVLKELCVAD
jgi:transposase